MEHKNEYDTMERGELLLPHITIKDVPIIG